MLETPKKKNQGKIKNQNKQKKDKKYRQFASTVRIGSG